MTAGIIDSISPYHERTPKVQTAAAYLDTLNPEQRRAVEHGAAGGLAAAPLLVIAGAGSGKTNTLAHRVAHLIVQGADPRRILLMTFSLGERDGGNLLIEVPFGPHLARLLDTKNVHVPFDPVM